jgi:hypothetical protein
MKIVYFTRGDSLQDEQIRQQLVRIPEVLSEIRKMKFQSSRGGQDPVLTFLSLSSGGFDLEFKALEPWVEVVQRGLFQRFRKMGIKYAGLFKRSRLNKLSSLEAVLVPLLQARRQIEIYVIGPGFDDLAYHLQEIQNRLRLHCEITMIDVIAQDRKLSWFWPAATRIGAPTGNLSERSSLSH